MAGTWWFDMTVSLASPHTRICKYDMLLLKHTTLDFIICGVAHWLAQWYEILKTVPKMTSIRGVVLKKRGSFRMPRKRTPDPFLLLQAKLINSFIALRMNVYQKQHPNNFERRYGTEGMSKTFLIILLWPRGIYPSLSFHMRSTTSTECQGFQRRHRIIRKRRERKGRKKEEKWKE